MGNPRFYATWTDEGINHELAKIGRSCHRHHFAERVLDRFNNKGASYTNFNLSFLFTFDGALQARVPEVTYLMPCLVWCDR
jgi:hypothetical protein